MHVKLHSGPGKSKHGMIFQLGARPAIIPLLSTVTQGDVSNLQRIIQVADLPSWLLTSLNYCCWLPPCLGALFATGKTIYLNFKSWTSFPVYTFQTVLCRISFNQIYFLWFLLQRNGIEWEKKKKSSEVEGDGFGDGNILVVPSEIFVAALLFKKIKMHVSKAPIIQWNQMQIIALNSLKVGLFTFFI